MTHALCAMKNALVRLLTRANPVELLRRLIEILADTVEPVRPGRSIRDAKLLVSTATTWLQAMLLKATLAMGYGL